MRTTGKNVFDSFEETFLTIGEEYESFVDEGLKCMALNHGQKKLQEPEPVLVVFHINNSMGKREQTTVGIDRSGSQDISYIELGMFTRRILYLDTCGSNAFHQDQAKGDKKQSPLHRPQSR